MKNEYYLLSSIKAEGEIKTIFTLKNKEFINCGIAKKHWKVIASTGINPEVTKESSYSSLEELAEELVDYAVNNIDYKDIFGGCGDFQPQNIKDAISRTQRGLLPLRWKGVNGCLLFMAVDTEDASKYHVTKYYKDGTFGFECQNVGIHDAYPWYCND